MDEYPMTFEEFVESFLTEEQWVFLPKENGTTQWQAPSICNHWK